MNRFYFCLLFIIVSYSSIAQNSLIEWQEKLRTAKHDTTRMVCYLEIADLQSRADSIFFYTKKGLSISKKFPNHIVNIKFLGSLGRAYTIKGEPDSAVYYLEQSHKIALKLQDDKQIKYSYFNRILLYKSPAQQINELIKMLKKYDYTTLKEYDKILLCTLYRVISKNYINLENIDKGKEYLKKSQVFISTHRDSVLYDAQYSTLLSSEAKELLKTKNTDLIKKISENYKTFLADIEIAYGKKKDNLSKQLLAAVYGNYSTILTYEEKYQESIYFINKATVNIKDLPESLLYDKYHALGENYVRLGKVKQGML